MNGHDSRHAADSLAVGMQTDDQSNAKKFRKSILKRGNHIARNLSVTIMPRSTSVHAGSKSSVTASRRDALTPAMRQSNLEQSLRAKRRIIRMLFGEYNLPQGQQCFTIVTYYGWLRLIMTNLLLGTPLPS